MAYAILNKTKNLSFVAANDADIDACVGIRGCLESGECGYKVTISEDDFNSIRFYEKHFDSSDGTTVVLQDLTSTFDNETDLKNIIEYYVNRLKKERLHKSESFQTRMDDMVTALSNIDTSSITYPLNKSVPRYLNDQGITVLSDLQF